MSRPLAADTDVKNIYLAFTNKARIEYEYLVKKVDRLEKAKETCFNYLSARKGSIATDLHIILDDYIIEFVNQEYNPLLALEAKVTKLLKSKKDKNRRDIIELAKWCSILKNQDATFNRLRICKKKANLTYSEYRQCLFDYYCQVHKILLNGDAYKFNYGIGTIYFKRFKFNEKYKSIDYAATRKRKEEIIAAGATPYNKLDAINAEYYGKEYNGIPYIQYKTDEYGYKLVFDNSLYIRGYKNYEFKPVKYINAKYRGYTYPQILKRFCDTEDDINYLQVDLKTKLSLLLLMNPGRSLNFIRDKKI